MLPTPLASCHALRSEVYVDNIDDDNDTSTNLRLILAPFATERKWEGLKFTGMFPNPAAAPVGAAGTRVVERAVARDVEVKVFEGEVRQFDGVPPVAVSSPQV